MEYLVYVLKSTRASKSYVGITSDLTRRLSEHNSGKHPYTKRYLPWKVVYTETEVDRETARKREKYLKSAAGRRFLKKAVNWEVD
ncbi:MAG: GIY-YIG nuclease family protein [Candidatus Brennerbacteria bacterium]